MEKLEKKPVVGYKSKLTKFDFALINSSNTNGTQCLCNGWSSAKDGTCCCGNAAQTIARR